jgi:hypothetical protein
MKQDNPLSLGVQDQPRQHSRTKKKKGRRRNRREGEQMILAGFRPRYAWC